jgi:hypothetical protein
MRSQELRCIAPRRHGDGEETLEKKKKVERIRGRIFMMHQLDDPKISSQIQGDSSWSCRKKEKNILS